MMTLIEQPPLPLGWVPRMGEADYFVSDSNRAAVHWLSRPTVWPMPRCLILGPPASGKSHLAGMVAARTGARLIEDADRLDDGEPLFHAWNAATAERPLLMTGRVVPKLWAHRLPDLGSRLAATPVVWLPEPDDALLAAVLAKRFADRGLRVADDVIQWLALRIERRFTAAGEAVDTLDAVALAERREITVPLARAALEHQLSLEL
ncbi:HdaA/DnaA family protein [Polymorphobacter sp.]|uniref:HdaA/DnaA family protein n=1 Tax=Polymorphobacter sp. TaxID=1909290 RepID=UPI003F72B079